MLELGLPPSQQRRSNIKLFVAGCIISSPFRNFSFATLNQSPPEGEEEEEEEILNVVISVPTSPLNHLCRPFRKWVIRSSCRKTVAATILVTEE